MSLADVTTEFADLLIDTVTIAAKNGQDAYGKRTFAAAATYPRCRVQTGSHQYRTPDGREVLAAGVVFLLGTPAIGTEDRLLLGGVGGLSVNVLGVEVSNDERGAHHTKITFGHS